MDRQGSVSGRAQAFETAAVKRPELFEKLEGLEKLTRAIAEKLGDIEAAADRISMPSPRPVPQPQAAEAPGVPARTVEFSINGIQHDLDGLFERASVLAARLNSLV